MFEKLRRILEIRNFSVVGDISEYFWRNFISFLELGNYFMKLWEKSLMISENNLKKNLEIVKAFKSFNRKVK